jgi:DNA-binding transcriptional MerR regulator
VSENGYSLIDLAEVAGVEARTIRSYIERGLLPGALNKGRAASYSQEHLSRLEIIKSLRRARPNITLSEIRIFLEGLNPERLHALAGGSITASGRAIDESLQRDDVDGLDVVAEDDDANPRMIHSDRSAAKLTGAERVVRLLREVSRVKSPGPASKVEGWQRISVTPDIEFSVRSDFDANQLMAFRELADLLRQLLQHSNALSSEGDE